MAAINKVLVDGVQLTTGAVNLYDSPSGGLGTRITALTATNQDVTTRTYTIYIVPDGGSATDSNLILKAKALTPNEDDEPAAVTNQLIPPGGSLQILGSVASAISIRASGIEFT